MKLEQRIRYLNVILDQKSKYACEKCLNESSIFWMKY